MTMIALLSELLLKNDDNYTWLSLTNNEIGIPIPELTEALSQNHSLRKVSCHAGFLGSLPLGDLGQLIHALSKLGNLQDLWLALPSKHACRSSAVLETILLRNNSNSSNNNDDDNTQGSCRLQKLTVRGADDAGCKVLAKALRRPSSCITDLQIRGTTTTTTTTTANTEDGAAAPPPSRITRQGILAIADMLRVNTSLERLDLCYKGLDSKSCQAMAKALAANDKLQKLDLTSPTSTSTTTVNNTRRKESLRKGFDALVKTMRHNYSLQHLNTQAEGPQKTMLDLLTKLNRTGARAFMRNTSASSSSVLEVLLDYNSGKDALSAVFELLSLNPALWDPVKADLKGFSIPDSASASTSNIGLSPSSRKRGSVMARWNANIFSAQEREKIKNFKRWTPTVLDTTPAQASTSNTRAVPRAASLDFSSMFTESTGALKPTANGDDGPVAPAAAVANGETRAVGPVRSPRQDFQPPITFWSRFLGLCPALSPPSDPPPLATGDTLALPALDSASPLATAELEEAPPPTFWSRIFGLSPTLSAPSDPPPLVTGDTLALPALDRTCSPSNISSFDDVIVAADAEVDSTAAAPPAADTSSYVGNILSSGDSDDDVHTQEDCCGFFDGLNRWVLQLLPVSLDSDEP